MEGPTITIDVATEQRPQTPGSTGFISRPDDAQIHWETHTIGDSTDSAESEKLVLIQGFAAASDAWYPLLNELRVLWGFRPHGQPPLSVLCIDNRRIGRSSAPKRKRHYSTTILAKDALAAMDHVGWHSAHVGGFSMGGMVATKLAALAPERVKSLVLMGVTGGGIQALPHSWKAFKLAIKGLLAKTVREGAQVDVQFHFSKHILRKQVPELTPARSVKDLLFEEYTVNSGQAGPQPKEGFNGQLHAIWKHSVTASDTKNIRAGGYPVWFIHGRNDLVAMPKFAERLAAHFQAPCVYFTGAHLIFRENAFEVALLLRSILTDLKAKAKWSVVSDLQLQLHVDASADAQKNR